MPSTFRTYLRQKIFSDRQKFFADRKKFFADRQKIFCYRHPHDNRAGVASFCVTTTKNGNEFQTSVVSRVFEPIHDFLRMAGPSRCMELAHYVSTFTQILLADITASHFFHLEKLMMLPSGTC